ncbi:MAG: tRNA (adenosine(37)-N6)-threonylcarbamoyltransferase complex dimerization subunit type 1 TsaB [Alphaproteobacteria bacterium]|nr:tRNA (adenosine(37)-N6)-threonylcarbamoyltransferase complex dimerization subunit type 1 TsaB [Alphaproteobacteria bacterium]
MRLLAVDTALGACSAALLQDDRVLAARRAVMERGHAEALAPMVKEVMRDADFAALDRLAVTTGPGTFTGQRVGLAFMRALHVATARPLVGVTSLAAMAAQAQAETGGTTAAAVHDARRDEVYLEILGTDDPRILSFAAACELLRGAPGLVLAGTAAGRVAQALAPVGVAVSAIVAPDAIWVARLAALRSPAGVPRPLYLRPPDARVPAAR